MKIFKKIFVLFFIVLLIQISPLYSVNAEDSRVENILESMTNKEKIAQMIMPAFRRKSGGEINEDNIEDILSKNNYAGVILFDENTPDVEGTMRFIDLMQNANKNNKTRLLIAIDQEGGYVTRLGVETNMPGNMALAATNNPDNAYLSAGIIGSELKALGININFAPVVDVNSNPANTVVGVRAFSDNPNIVATYGKKFMKGLQDKEIITSLKHFPGHGSTETDTHTGLAIVYKTYDELKENELVPFQALIDGGTDMIMTAHIQFPNIETDTYVSKSDGELYTLPATLSKTILTDILRGDMGFEGVIITDALDMDAISENFELEDASIKAINAGANILLMPFEYDTEGEELDEYVTSLAEKIGEEIDEDNVNDSVRRILELKEKNGLLDEYDNSNLETNITKAKSTVSSKKNHNTQIEITKESITMVKNENNVLPLNGNDKTVILYEYSSHIKAVSNAISMLKKSGTTINEDNVSTYSIYNSLSSIKDKLSGVKNVVIINSLYDTEDLKDDGYFNKMNEIIDYVHGNGGNVIGISAQLPYDVTKFQEADAILITYLANGVRIDIDDYDSEIPKYGPNVMTSIYMLFTKRDNMKGVLPVNIYSLDENNDITDEILYERGFGLKYYKPVVIDEDEEDSEISITRGYSYLKLDWNEESDYKGYKVYRKVSGGKWKIVKTIKNKNTTTYKDTNVVTGKEYYYKVRPYKVVNGKNKYGEYSDIVSAYPKRPSTTTVYLDKKYKTKIKLSYEEVSTASGYEIYRSTSKNGKYTLVKRTKNTYYTNTGLKSKKYYYYKIRSYKLVNGKKIYSKYSNVLKVKTK